MKILVLEDNRSQLEKYTCFLKENDFEVISTGNSKEALSAFKEHSDIDLLICDITLDRDPEDRRMRITGLDVAKEAVTSYLLPIMFFTDHHDDTDYQQKAQEVLHKMTPFRFLSKNLLDLHPDRFLQHIDLLLGEFFGEVKYNNRIVYADKIGISKSKGEPYLFYKRDKIIYCQTNNGYTEIFFPAETNSIIITGSLNAVFRQIKPHWPNFIKLGGSLVINADHLQKYYDNTIWLNGGKPIVLNTGANADFKKKILFLRTR